MRLYEACIDGGYVVRYVVFEHDGGLRSAYAAAKAALPRDREVLRGIDPLDGILDTAAIRATHDVVTI